MAQIFLKLLNMSITASWIVLAVIFLRLLLKKAPKWINCILWGIVGIRLVLPFSVESILSLIPSSETVPQEIVYTTKPEIYTGITAFNSTINPVITETMAPKAEESVTPMQLLSDIASIVWLCGIALMILYAVISYIRLYKRTKESLFAEDNIWLCDKIPSPFILGVVKPKIFLPSSLNEEDIDFVVAHEKAHIKRRDHIWKPLGFALLTVYWFNPILWIAYILLCRDIELACDEKVIKQMGEDAKKRYSNALINCSTHQRLVTACPVAFGEVGVKSRIKSVLSYKKPAFWIIIIALVACIALGVFFLTDPKGKDVGRSDMKYTAVELVYDAPMYSYVQSVETAPEFYITEDMHFRTKNLNGVVTEHGILEKIKLTEEKFDSRFWLEYFEDHETIKKNNKKAWEVLSKAVTGDLYIVLEQNDGTVYIGQGYQTPNNNSIRWLYKTKAYNGDIPNQTAYFEGSVSSVSTTTISIDVSSDYHDKVSDSVYISTKAKNGEELPVVKVGEYIRVYYDGIVQETYPCGIPGVMSIRVLSEDPPALYPQNADVYVYTDSPDLLEPTIRLSKDDNSFSFTYSMFSSYVAVGEYENTATELILRTEDGKREYRFTVKNDTLIFDAKNSSEMPEYAYSADSSPESPVPDKAEFKLLGSNYPAIDSTSFDIDYDGKKEELSIGVGPTSGIFTFTLNVSDNGKQVYNEVYTYDSCGLMFTENEDGNLQIKAELYTGETRYFDVVLENGHVSLYEKGVNIAHLYAQGVDEFSYNEEMENYKGTASTICIDMHTAVPDIKTAREAILSTHDRVSVSYDRVSVAYDQTKDIWKVNYYTENTLGGGQPIYITSDRTTITVIYGE